MGKALTAVAACGVCVAVLPVVLGIIIGAALSWPAPFLRDMQATSPANVGLQYEDIEFQTQAAEPPWTSFQRWAGLVTPATNDTLTLRGWFMPGRKHPETCVVGVHGAGNTRFELLQHAPLVSDFSVLLFDLRSRGGSDSDSLGLGFGFREHVDVTAAVAYLRREWQCSRVVAVGMSAGGAAVLLAANGSEPIDGVVVVSTFANFRDLLQEKLDDFKHIEGSEAVWRVQKFLGPVVAKGLMLATKVPGWDMLEQFVMGMVLHRLGVSDTHPVDVFDKLSVPTLLVHGTHDSLIHYRHHNRLVAAAKSAGTPHTSVLVPKAGHSATWLLSHSPAFRREFVQLVHKVHAQG